MRLPKVAVRRTRRNVTLDMVSISDRPSEVEDRKVPTHLTDF